MRLGDTAIVGLLKFDALGLIELEECKVASSKGGIDLKFSGRYFHEII